MNIEELNKIGEELKKSPLFNLSLASKELFHSNFLYWLSKYKLDLFVSVMGRLADSTFNWDNSYKVEREKKQFDLSVWNDKEEVVFVLENKVKSIPYEDQLNKYTAKSPNAVRVLLSLTKMQNCPKNDWVQKNYCELSDILTSFVSDDDSYEGLLIKDYAKYIKNIHNLSTKWLECIKVDKALGELLEELRLDDVYQKSTFSSLCMKLEQKIETSYMHVDKFEDIINNNNNGVKYYTRYDMMHGEGLFEVAFKKADLIYEIMIQGNKYQHMIYGQGKMEELEIMKESYPFVFKAEKYPEIMCKDKFLGNGNGKGYNSYEDKKAKKYTVYKYFTLDEKITHEDLIDAIIEDLRKNSN